MQPFDALTMRAVLVEAKHVLLNRRVDKIQQISRDEVVISLRSKAGTSHLLVSAQASFGRLCLALNPPQPRSSNPPPFCQLLRKHLSSSVLAGLEQVPGERIADLSFSCVDELGNRSTKILTAEIMGRHSNLILWEAESNKILGASHVVTQEMSRQREVAPGLKYVRPPRQEKPAIFSLKKEDLQKAFDELRVNFGQPAAGEKSAQDLPQTFEQWLMTNFAGLGRHLSEEIVEAACASSELKPELLSENICDSLWSRIETIQRICDFSPSMKLDLTRFSVLSWWKESDFADASLWQEFPSTNDMVDAYFRGVHLRTEIQQLKDRIRAELKAEQEKLRNRLDAAEKLMEGASDLERLKKSGDMILAHAAQIVAGSTALECADLYSESGQALKIELNPNLSASQNAQHYYRLFAKSRIRAKTASSSSQDARQRMEEVQDYCSALERAESMPELMVLKEKVLDRGKKSEAPKPALQSPRSEKTAHQRLMSTRSSDGFTIIVGRNKQENDVLISRLTHPQDIWLHAQGIEGAHVLIKLPNKKDPPQSTINEAAQIAARFARTGLGGKVRVAYTYGKYVRKIAKDKPGLVRYENEKTLEVDTTAPMPAPVRRLFS